MQGGGSFIETALIVAMLGVALVFGLTWIADWYAWKRTERAIEEVRRATDEGSPGGRGAAELSRSPQTKQCSDHRGSLK